MPIDHSGDPLPVDTYNGFSGPGQRQYQPHEYERRRRRGSASRPVLIGGLAVAIGLGVLLGVAARPELDLGPAPAEPMQPVVQAPPAEAQVEIKVAQPQAPPPSPLPAEPLEVLPPELARAAPRPPAPRPAERRREPEAAPAQPRTQPEFAEAPSVRPPPPAFRRAVAEPSFSCRYARTPAERMICDDPQLAALDRQLDQAYRRAIASGVPARFLRGEQDDWLMIREDAARYSPRAVASVYAQRIFELEAMADGAPLG